MSTPTDGDEPAFHAIKDRGGSICDSDHHVLAMVGTVTPPGKALTSHYPSRQGVDSGKKGRSSDTTMFDLGTLRAVDRHCSRLSSICRPPRPEGSPPSCRQT